MTGPASRSGRSRSAIAKELRHAVQGDNRYDMIGSIRELVCEAAAVLEAPVSERTRWIESQAAQGMHVNPGDELMFRNGRFRIMWTVPALPSPSERKGEAGG